MEHSRLLKASCSIWLIALTIRKFLLSSGLFLSLVSFHPLLLILPSGALEGSLTPLFFVGAPQILEGRKEGKEGEGGRRETRKKEGEERKRKGEEGRRERKKEGRNRKRGKEGGER
ncbi:Transcription initiation factor TFIID subunit 3, partial [Ophiophagus hannah]